MSHIVVKSTGLNPNSYTQPLPRHSAFYSSAPLSVNEDNSSTIHIGLLEGKRINTHRVLRFMPGKCQVLCKYLLLLLLLVVVAIVMVVVVAVVMVSSSY